MEVSIVLVSLFFKCNDAITNYFASIAHVHCFFSRGRLPPPGYLTLSLNWALDGTNFGCN